MGKVSVITPTFNREGTIGGAIESVLSQSFPNFEYVIVDDGSTDGTDTVIQRYDDERISQIQLPNNQGANIARNAGIEAATGEFITFLDSDDRWLPHRLETTLHEIEHTSNDICGVTHSFESVISDEVVTVSRVDNGRITLNDLAKRNAVGGFSNVLFRSEIFDNVGLLDEEMPSYQDYEFYLRALQAGDIVGIDEVLCKKLKEVKNGSKQRISNDLKKKIHGQELLLDKYGDILSKRARSAFYYTRGRLYMQSGELAKSRSAFRTALTLYPYRPLYLYNLLFSILGHDIFMKAQHFKRQVGLKISRP